MLEYIQVLWRHDSDEDPVEIFYEVLPDRCVPRMVEVFLDGRSIANSLVWEKQAYPSFVGISLADDMTDFEQIPNNDEFTPRRISKEAFETAFLSATPLPETIEKVGKRP